MILLLNFRKLIFWNYPHYRYRTTTYVQLNSIWVFTARISSQPFTSLQCFHFVLFFKYIPWDKMIFWDSVGYFGDNLNLYIHYHLYNCCTLLKSLINFPIFQTVTFVIFLMNLYHRNSFHTVGRIYKAFNLLLTLTKISEVSARCAFDY